MIQRSQSLWLFIATVFAFLSLTFTFFSGTKIDGGIPEIVRGLDYLLVTILTSGLGILSLITIFLFKNRKRQMWLTVLGLIVSVGIIALYFLRMKDDTSVTISIFSIFTFLLPIFYILALRGIYADMRLIKSLDRLR